MFKLLNIKCYVEFMEVLKLRQHLMEKCKTFSVRLRILHHELSLPEIRVIYINKLSKKTFP